MEGCIFCRIINGEIPSYKVYEDEDILAVLDINPIVKGHTLVLPKRHSKWVWDMEDQGYQNLMGKVKHLAIALRQAFNTEWVAEGIAGVDIPHSHVHLLPRDINDGLGAFPPSKTMEPKLSDQEMEEIAQRIKEKII